MFYRKLRFKTFSLRSSLVVIVLAAVLPVLIFSGLMINRLGESKLEANQRLLMQIAEQLAQAFDEEVSASLRSMKTMSQSSKLWRRDLKSYHAMMKHILATQTRWRNILLVDPEGRKILSALDEYGRDLGEAYDVESVKAVVRGGTPVVGNVNAVDVQHDRKEADFAILVPVWDEKKEVIYVLTALLSLEPTQEFVNRFSRIPGEWVLALVDGAGTIAGRSRDSGKYIGQKVTESFLKMILQQSKGLHQAETLDGIQAFTGIVQAPLSGWYAAVAVPEDLLLIQVRETQQASFILGFILLAFSAAATVVISSRITGSIRAGSSAAADLAQGKTPEMPYVGITELNELRKSLLSASELLKSRDKAKDEFLANMSHELRTPLGIVLGMTDLLSKNIISAEERPRTWEIVHRNGQHLQRLIDDILDFSKVEADRLTIENIEFSISDLIGDVVEDFSMAAKKKGILLKFEAENRSSDLVKTDPVRVRQVLSNLIGNAVKFTEKGSVVVLLHSSHSGKARITIKDTGIGLSEPQQRQLFQDFTQGDNSHTRKFGGTGLGLSLSRKIARLLKGDVRLIESCTGRGSVFEFSFESQSAQSERAPVEKSNAKTLKNTIAPGARILLAEDSPDNVALVKLFLKPLDAQIDIACNGNEAIEYVKKGDSYQLILMDIQMPDLDGFDATARIRELGVKTPVVALTAHTLDEHKKRALESGFTDFLTKPIKKDVLLEIVSLYLSSRYEGH